jgi:DNA polymerase-3 subunit beta
MQLPPLKTAHIRAALIFASKEDVRYYLNGVCIEVAPDGAYIVATDGHRMFAVREPCEGLVPRLGNKCYIVPRAALESILKTSKGDSMLVRPSDDGKTAVLEFGGVSATCTLIDGRFPDWRRVIPAKDQSGMAGQFNGDYMADCVKVGKLLDTRSKALGGFGTPYIEHNGPEKACRVTWPGAQCEALGVVMPLRAEAPATPAWAQ